MRAASGEVFLMCDECESCFVHPDRAWALDGPDFNGNRDERALSAEYATMHDIETAGWKREWFFDQHDIR
jgi:hypothetical protein